MPTLQSPWVQRHRCQHCAFWRKYDSDPLGECQRFPPTTPPPERTTYQWEGCGEWRGMTDGGAAEPTAAEAFLDEIADLLSKRYGIPR